MLPIHTILHPTDFSENAAFAFRLACSLARDYGARLIVLHIVPQPALPYAGVMTPPPPELPVAEEKKQLHQIKADDPKIPLEHMLRIGDPAAGICQLAAETKSDLIIMGTHGRTGIGRVLMGSVAELVVRKAPCPVLTVKAGQS